VAGLVVLIGIDQRGTGCQLKGVWAPGVPGREAGLLQAGARSFACDQTQPRSII